MAWMPCLELKGGDVQADTHWYADRQRRGFIELLGVTKLFDTKTCPCALLALVGVAIVFWLCVGVLCAVVVSGFCVGIPFVKIVSGLFWRMLR